MKWFKGTRKHTAAVDAVAEITAHTGELSGDRGRPQLEGVARSMAPGAKGFLTLLALILVLLVGVVVHRLMRSGDVTETLTGALAPKIGSVLPDLKLRDPDPVHTPAPAPAPPPTPDPVVSYVSLPSLTAHVPTLPDPVEQRQLSAGLQGEHNQRQSTGGQPVSGTNRPHDSGPMADRLQPMRLSTAKAGVVGNRDLLLTQGAMIDCVQQTKFVSAQAGMLTCYATREIRSASGRVVLIDAGTIFTGYQQSVLAHGEPRIGIVWSRLETPSGVVVHLDSPGTGPLGEAGLDGEIDTHFAQRFGSAIMISLIDDLGGWISSRGGRNQSDSNIRFDNTSDATQQAVTTVLNNTINIPPTLYRNQAGRIGIYVARDLDFSSVYELRPTQVQASLR